jgi:L-histidine Nalpha-methyltransferase
MLDGPSFPGSSDATLSLGGQPLVPVAQREMGIHRLDVYIDNETRLPAFSEDLRQGLSGTPKRVPTKWLYDERGGTLFGAITRTADYYVSRAEASIIDAHARGVDVIAQAETFVDLGSNFTDRTAKILGAMTDTGRLRTYVPFEIDNVTLGQTAREVAAQFPGTAVHAIVGDFDQHLPAIARDGQQLVGLLGQTYGNFPPAERNQFLATLRGALRQDDTLMLGVDLIKDPDRLTRAYDDREGATRAFVMNILTSINETFGADFDLKKFSYHSEWNQRESAVEMMLRSKADQVVHIPGLDTDVQLSSGENLYVGRSRKFELCTCTWQPEVDGACPDDRNALASHDVVRND